MNEDLKPLYDIQSLWGFPPTVIKDGMIHIYKHKLYPKLYRVIDFEREVVYFNDIGRVDATTIIDINKDIGVFRKNFLVPFTLQMLNELKPIKMPYVPEKIKVYVEDLGGYVGLLYFKDTDEDESLVPIKRYFEVKNGGFYEVDFESYNKYKEEMDAGD